MRSGLLSLLLFIISHAYAQNARLVLSNPNIRLVSSGSNAQIVLSNGNWENNASTASFVHGNGIVQSKGASLSTIGGTAQTQFYNLISDKAGSETQLANHIQVVNQANLVNGNFHLQNHTLDLLTSGSLVGEVYPNGKRFYCLDNQSGIIRAERSINTGINANIAGMGADLNILGTAPGISEIKRGHDRQTSSAFVGAGTSIGRFYDISPANNTGFTYTFLFRYHEQELYAMPENNLTFYRSPSYGVNTADWEEWGMNPPGPLSPGFPTVGITLTNPIANEVSLTGINSFSRWTLSDWQINPLPIVLGAFDLHCADKKIEIEWTTLSEINNAYFQIQRSINGIEWENIAEIPGSGNSNMPLQYSYSDASAPRGMVYYRLKQVDYNGSFEIFGVKSIACHQDAASRVLLYPNPTRESFTIEFELDKNYSEAHIELIDMTGRVVGQKNLELTEGFNSYTYSPLPVSGGVYTVRIKAQGEVLLQSPIVIHKH